MRTLFSLIVVALLLAIPAAVLAHTQDDPYVADLIAGQTQDIGDVKIWNDDEDLHVIYEFEDPLPFPWSSLDQTHLEVQDVFTNIPQANGNPIPGKFTYKEPGSLPTIEYIIPLEVNSKKDEHEWDFGELLYIAAHAKVCGEYADVASIIDVLPEKVTMDLSLPDPATHFIVEISNPDPDDKHILDGIHIGYCIDMLLPIDVVGASYTGVNVNTNGLDVMDKINYILNQDYSGMGAGNAEIQAAIWLLVGFTRLEIEDYLLAMQAPPHIPYPDPAPDLDIAEAIVADADTNGGGYEPECGGYLALKLEPLPVGEIDLQRILIRIPLGCGCGTAWGAELSVDGDGTYGYDFPGKNWAHYLKYEVQDPSAPAPPRMSLDSSVTTTWGSIKNR